MGWLRRDKDCIALVVVWALLLQAALLAFTAGAHAASLASGENVILCTLKGAVSGDPAPGHQADHPCCTMSCRLASGSAGNAGLLPLALRVPLPASIETPAEPPRLVEHPGQPSDASPAQPRAPPRA
jgi:hypothetical protein